MDSTDPIARTDQLTEEVRHLAPILGSHFHSLLLQGFERVEALELTRDLQASMVDGDGEDE